MWGLVPRATCAKGDKELSLGFCFNRGFLHGLSVSAVVYVLSALGRSV